MPKGYPGAAKTGVERVKAPKNTTKKTGRDEGYVDGVSRLVTRNRNTKVQPSGLGVEPVDTASLRRAGDTTDVITSVNGAGSGRLGAKEIAVGSVAKKTGK